MDVSALAFGAGDDGALWVADATDRSLIEIDPASGAVRRTFALQVEPTALAIVTGTIWVAAYDANAVAEVDLRSGQTVATITVGNGPSAVAIDGNAVWVVNALDSTVSRIDARSGSVVATIPVGSSPAAIAVAGGSLWVANLNSASVSRIDPRTNSVVSVSNVGRKTGRARRCRRSRLGGHASAQLPPRRHLRLLFSHPISIDPALQLDLFPFQSDGLTRDGLVTYNHVAGPAGTQLVPDLAVRLPFPTEAGPSTRSGCGRASVTRTAG